MKQVKGFWLPDHEEHLVPFLETGPRFAGGPTYQMHKWEKALPLVKRTEHFVDIGAHCGLWARPLATVFERVTAFEPLPAHLECLTANMQTFRLANLVVHDCALGDQAGTTRLHSVEGSSGDSSVNEAGEIEAWLARLDDFDLPQIDFLKADCEGFEYFALKGGERTIRRDRPVVIVEQKPQHAGKYGLPKRAAVELLQSWGARLAFESSGDFCLHW